MLLVILNLHAILSLHAQKVVMGVLAGANMNFVTIKSDYKLSENYKPTSLLSYNTGYFLKTNFKKFGIMVSGEYQRTATKDNLEFVMTDAFGTPMVGYDKKQLTMNSLSILLARINSLKKFIVEQVYCVLFY